MKIKKSIFLISIISLMAFFLFITGCAIQTGSSDKSIENDFNQLYEIPTNGDEEVEKHWGTRDYSNTVGVKLSDFIINTWPNINDFTKKDWEYNNGIILAGILKVYKQTGNVKYIKYIKDFVDIYVDNSGDISPIRVGHNQDVIQPSILLYTLYKVYKDEKYKLCIAKTREKFNTFPVNEFGGFWHKYNYSNQVWLDGVYMSEPFLTQYPTILTYKDYKKDPVFVLSEMKFCYDTPTFQLKLLAEKTYDPAKKLFYHAWNPAKDTAWADPVTGVSPEIWCRAQGWFAMALVDVLDYLPRWHSDYYSLIKIVRNLAEGLEAAQDASTGLWYQVVDKGTAEGNFLETSGSAMNVYMLKKAVNNGYISRRFSTVASRGWQGVKSKVEMNADGTVVVKGAVGGMGVMVDYANYVNKPIVDNIQHGLAAVLMASSVMEF